MLRRLILLVSGSGGLLLLLALWSITGVQARNAQTPISIPNVEDLSFVNHIGGSVFAVAKAGNYAYVGMGPRLLVMDVQDPTQPIVLGQTNVLSDTVSRIRVVGNYAYLSVDEGLSIVDVSSPGAPAQVGFFDTFGPLYDIAISDTLAYLAEGRVWDGSQFLGGGLRIIDVSDPANPIQSSYLNTNQSSNGISLLGTYAYLNNSSGTAGFRVIDISDPALPNEVNFVNVFSVLGFSTINNGYLYFASPTDGLLIFDLADPQNPVSVTSYDTPSETSDVFINNNRAYLADYSSMIILDISTPSSPMLLGSYHTTASAILQVSTDSDFAYLANRNEGFKVIDVSDAAAPDEVAAYDVFTPYKIEVENGYAYLMDYDEGLHILDLANGIAPEIVGSYGPQFTNDLKVSGDSAYLVVGSTLIILDIAIPSSPTLTIQYPISGTAQALDIVGNYAYVADYAGGLQVIDISNPQAPSISGALGLPSSARHVAVANGFAYVVGSSSNNVYIVDVSAPMTPTLTATYPLTTSVYGIDAVGNYAYLAQNGVGLHVVDVTSPTLPTVAGIYPLGWYASLGDIEVVDGFAYLSSSANGVAMFDISAPTTPMLLDSYDTTGVAEDLALTNDYVYVADSIGGLLILGGNGLPTLSVNNASIVEGNSGTAVLSFTVALNSPTPLTQTVTVDYATADGTAVAYQDYHPISGTLIFTPGQATQMITVPIVGDTAVESDEIFFLNLSNPINAILLDDQATGTILNDDMEQEIEWQVYLPLILRP